ncbi:MAG: divalent metal cation transporter [Salibacteraceae bacterium]
MLSSLKRKMAMYGPGLLYAGAAVGVSHLVQSTRAGAEFGFSLLWLIILVNVVKYPVFEAGPRYAAITGKSLLDGYNQLHRYAVWLYIVITVSTMFIIMAAIAVVTAGLFSLFSGISADVRLIASAMLAASALILAVGHYSMLDQLMKFIIVILTLCTLLALVFAFVNQPTLSAGGEGSFSWLNREHVIFLAALIGWMPAPVDISIWHSVWTVSKSREQGRGVDLPSALRDFKLGYWGTTFLACCFLTLGAKIMHGEGIKPASSAVAFSSQFVSMYTKNLGSWSFIIIALAAFTTMFSTLLTCLDAFPRTLRTATKLIFPQVDGHRYHYKIYLVWLALVCVGTIALLLFMYSNMQQMVDTATTISFVIAPVLAWLNYLTMAKTHQGFSTQRRAAYLVSLFVLAAFSVAFLVYRYGFM